MISSETATTCEHGVLPLPYLLTNLTERSLHGSGMLIHSASARPKDSRDDGDDQQQAADDQLAIDIPAVVQPIERGQHTARW